MKNAILVGLLCVSLNVGAFAAENAEIVNSDKVNQILEIDNFKKSDKEQEILNIYKERLNLLSFKERQLKIYESSLKSMKKEIDIMHIDFESKQNEVNEKEIALLKKELQLREKERDLKQLEEKLSQIDNIQLTRESVNVSTPSVSSIKFKNDTYLTSNLNAKEGKYAQLAQESSVLPESSLPQVLPLKADKVESKREVKPRKLRVEASNVKIQPNVNSGLGAMKKDILNSTTFK